MLQFDWSAVIDYEFAVCFCFVNCTVCLVFRVSIYRFIDVWKPRVKYISEPIYVNTVE